MNLIARLFYLLNAYKPSFTANSIVKNIFSIIYRCVRHSSQITYELLEKYTPFIDLIVAKFLPKFIDLTLTTDQISNIEMTLKLLRLMSSSGVNCATKIFEKYDLKTRLVNYLTILNSSVLNIHTETIRLIKTLSYLIPSNVTVLIDFELMLQNAKSIITQEFLDNKIATNYVDYEQNAQYLQSSISLFNSLIGIITTTTLLDEMCNGFLSIIRTFLLNKFKFYYFSSDANFSIFQFTTDFSLMSQVLLTKK